MSKAHTFTFDIEVYDPNVHDEWKQGTFLVHGLDDVLWTDNIGDAITFIEESCLRALGQEKEANGN